MGDVVFAWIAKHRASITQSIRIAPSYCGFHQGARLNVNPFMSVVITKPYSPSFTAVWTPEWQAVQSVKMLAIESSPPWLLKTTW